MTLDLHGRYSPCRTCVEAGRRALRATARGPDGTIRLHRDGRAVPRSGGRICWCASTAHRPEDGPRSPCASRGGRVCARCGRPAPEIGRVRLRVRAQPTLCGVRPVVGLRQPRNRDGVVRRVSEKPRRRRRSRREVSRVTSIARAMALDDVWRSIMSARVSIASSKAMASSARWSLEDGGPSERRRQSRTRSERCAHSGSSDSWAGDCSRGGGAAR